MSQQSVFQPTRIILGALEAAANQLLAQDPDIGPALHALNGRCAKITLLGVGVEFYMVNTDSQWVFLESYQREPDVIIEGSPFAFAQMALARDTHSLPDNLRLSGDIKTAQQFQSLLSKFDVDWEELLATQVGDVAARQMGLWAQSAKRWFGRTRTTAELALRDYVQEESKLSPTQIEVDNFSRDVSNLRMDVERLEARIQRLKQK